ncbi:hypothetical protein RHMOL_Rhmol08G0287000 [Rhododendron molle]|uniref:Uncharacterized protein n=1 Tax=Rhododendron molle TaxID=49168 RepID=A0ACC0MTT6_RHOML|nr:hypothetical protein RHMOL_Rhmol08G0287000 [Rhododendron molle]
MIFSEGVEKTIEQTGHDQNSKTTAALYPSFFHFAFHQNYEQTLPEKKRNTSSSPKEKTKSKSQSATKSYRSREGERRSNGGVSQSFVIFPSRPPHAYGGISATLRIDCSFDCSSNRMHGVGISIPSSIQS